RIVSVVGRFTAQLAGIDLKASEVRIAFQSNVWQPRIVPVEAVRCVPKRAAPGSFQPGPGDAVEVLSLGSDSTPPCWSLGVVRVVRDGLYYVNQQPDGDEGPLPSDREETIVELDHLRAPVQPQASPEHLQDDLVECASSLTKLKTEIYEVPQSLGDWLTCDDGRACMKYIAVRVRLSLVWPPPPPPRAAPPVEPIHLQISVQTSLCCDHPRVHLIGFAHTTVRASMLLSIHVDHQLEIQSFHHRRLLALGKQQHQQPRATTGGRSQRRAGDEGMAVRPSGPRKTTLQRASSSSSSTVKSAAVASENPTDLEAPRNLVVKFATTRRLLGLTIGKGGANVKSVQDEFGVNVR
ncbi:fragile X mental retardation, partial [Perkinsus olseni]